MDETKTESEYQLRLKDNKYAEEARVLKKKFNADISDLKQVIHKLENDKANMQEEQINKIQSLNDDHERAIADVSEQYKAKLIVEYQKYDHLEEMYHQLRKSYDKKMEDLELSTKKELQKMQADFDKQLAANEAEVKRYEKIGKYLVCMVLLPRTTLYSKIQSFRG